MNWTLLIAIASSVLAVVGFLGWILSGLEAAKAQADLEGLQNQAQVKIAALTRKQTEAADDARAVKNERDRLARDIKTKEQSISRLTADLERCQGEKAKLALNTPKKTG